MGADMNSSQTSTCCQFNERLSGYIDNELTQQEQQQIAHHLKQCDECKQQVKEMKAMQSMLREAKLPTLEQDRITAILEDKPSNAFQNIGWVLLMSGIAMLACFVLIEFIVSPSIPTFNKVVISLICGGIIGLFLGVARQQFIAKKTDKYKGVKL